MTSEIETPPIPLTDDTPLEMNFGQGPEQPQHNQPARRGRPPGSKNKPRDPSAPPVRRGRPRAYTLRDDIAGALQTINFVFLFVPAEYKDDYLTPDEIEKLADAIYHVAENNATVKKYLTAALKGSGLGTWVPLFTVIGGIVKVRMDRHGVSIYNLLTGTRNEELIEAEEEIGTYATLG